MAEWQAYESEWGPLGPERGDWQSAVVAHTIAMVNRDKKSRKYRLRDFLFRWGSGHKRQTPEEQLALLQAFASRHGNDR